MPRIFVCAALAAAALAVSAGSAFGCGSLVAANGAVNLEHTTTLAAYHDGVEHYITSFTFEGEQKSFGSIVPLPGRPTKVERGGDWTLQRLLREVAPPVLESAAARPLGVGEDKVEVLQQVRIDSLDVTILRGGGRAVARWANENGFDLPQDTPSVLEFYSERSPYFMAARFDATAALEQGLAGGDGTPVHLTIPLDHPWVPLRILSTAMPDDYPVKADVFLLTDREPQLMFGDGFSVQRSERASSSLLTDLRGDKGMGWVPEHMWFTYAKVDARAADVRLDLAIGARGESPDLVDLGIPRWLLSMFE